MKIGLLLPRSVIYPSISFDILDGIKTAFKMHQVLDVDVTSANIDLAAKDQDIYNAAQNMLLNGTEVIVAYINPKTAEFIHPIFISSGALLLVLDSGYHYPSSMQKLTNAFYISLQSALCCRITARLATENNSRNVAFTSSFYDAGYRSSDAFANALAERGADVVYNYVTPLKRSDFSLQPLLNFLETDKPDTLIASFCGDMAEDFLREADSLNLFAHAKVYGSPFMAEEIWLNKIKYPGNNWESTIAWARVLNTKENNTFVEEMEKIRSEKANLFSLLAWESACVIKLLIENNLPLEKSIQALEGQTLLSPRGEIFIDPDTHFLLAPTYRVTVSQNALNGNCQLENLEEIAFTEEERDLFYKDVQDFPEMTNSWLNAYACLDS